MADPDDTLDRKFPRGQPRDPARIDSILSQISEVWHQHPDMRLGQLFVNLLDPNWNAIFDVEDTELVERLNELRETGKWPTAQ